MADVTANIVVSMPSQLFTASRSFKALANGRIYVGKVDTDPSIPSNQVQVYIDDESGGLHSLLSLMPPASLYITDKLRKSLLFRVTAWLYMMLTAALSTIFLTC